MFGYVLPHVPELRVRELERFRALYCGMCRTLGRRYGYAARFVLSYDFVFLAALLWESEDKVIIKSCACPASLRRRRCVCSESCGGAEGDSALDRAAAAGLILAYHKLRDNVADEGFFKATAARAAMIALRRAYRKAVRDCPSFDAAVREQLNSLARLESDATAPPDKVADAFAALLAGAAELDGAAGAAEQKMRVLRNLLYNVGRWIYYLDARDDLAEDMARGRDSILRRAGREMDDEALELTLSHSNNLAIAAFELLESNAWSDIVRNILCLGMPTAQAQIFAGTWKRREGGKI